jgi:hypothetical protein
MKASQLCTTSLGGLFCWAVALAGCPTPPGPVVPTPDATDGQAVDGVSAEGSPVLDGAPSDPCEQACANLRAVGCVSARVPVDGAPYNCPAAMRSIETNKSIRRADGTWVTCAAVASAADPRLVSMRLCQ